MKLSDEKLMKLLMPIFNMHLGMFGIKNTSIKGEPNSSDEDSIFIKIELEKGGNYDYSLVLQGLPSIISNQLEEYEDKRYPYLSISFPKAGNYNEKDLLKKYEKLLEGLH